MLACSLALVALVALARESSVNVGEAGADAVLMALQGIQIDRFDEVHLEELRSGQLRVNHLTRG